MEINMELKDTIEGMTSADYKERFKAEYFQAVIRRDKLEAMLNKHAKKLLDFEPNSYIGVLVAQHSVLNAYVSILEVRAEQEHIELY